MGLSFSYTFKRLIRSWRLFIALLLGIVLASTFFAGINVGADTAAKQAIDKALSQVPVDFFVSASSFEGRASSSQNISTVMDRIRSVAGVKHVEVVSRILSSSVYFPGSNETFYATVAGMSETSTVYSNVSALKENETYVDEDSVNANKLHIGDVLSFNLTVSTESGIFQTVLNLTVAGFVRLSDQALNVASGQYNGSPSYIGVPGVPFYGDLLIVNWEKTFERMIDYLSSLPGSYGGTISTDILIYIDRSAFISPWDVSGSLSRLKMVNDQINDKIRIFNLEAQSYTLTGVLSNYQSTALNMRFLFTIISFPVFLVAWYMGSTVSDVSFNLRRREIGLLLTKGFSRRQLLQMFFVEAVIIGLFGGLIGIILTLLLNPVFVRAVGGEFSGTPFVGTGTLVITIVFSIILTFLASFQPARKASRLATVDALREYMPREDVKPYKRLWPWLAFGLGSYKIIILLLGVNLPTILRDVGGGNIGLIIVVSIAMVIDYILLFIGPFLFFWGFAKIFISGSLKFQEIVARAAKFLGDLGELATKSVQRNPARAASVAFLLASIIFYSVWMSGTLASMQDQAIRNVYFQVGADISASFESPQNASILMQRINENLSDVLASSTLEYSLYGTAGLVKAVNPNNWLTTAYYEDEFFTGNNAKKAFELLASDNQTIILERVYAQYLKKELGDNVSISLGRDTVELRIVGFFGLLGPSSFGETYTPSGPVSYYSSQYWSFISEGLYKQLSNETTNYSTPNLLIKLKEGADGKAVAERIREFGPSISQVSSVAEKLEEQKSDVTVTGEFNILRLGVVFVVLASSIGTALVTLVSLRERSRETAIMSVRGLSFPQILIMVLTENLAVVTFAVLLGAVIGLIAVRGTIAALNVSTSGAYVNMHMVFPFDTTLTILFSIVLVFASTIIPILFMIKRSSSKLERRVREV